MNRPSLMPSISAMLQKLFERFSARHTPAGYRPGVTLEHLRRNLGLAHFQHTASATAEAVLQDGQLHVEIFERTESQLLMHLVMTEFLLRVPASREGTASFELHHTGAVRRTGIRCRQRSGDPALLALLQPDGDLLRALMPLDFKRLRIELRAGQWCVRLEHMGGSEVVNRMPAFRRYIPLSADQRNGLVAALLHFQCVLATL